MVSMDNLPDQLVWEIFSRIKNTVDRNSVSLTCKRFHNLDNEQRNYLRVGCGLNPANEALTSLCHRFPYLNKVEITYSGWMSKLGKQLEDPGLFVLSDTCPFLTDLTLSYCTFITDAGLSSLASCLKLSSLKLNFTPRITGCGIFSIVVGCRMDNPLRLLMDNPLRLTDESLKAVAQNCPWLESVTLSFSDGEFPSLSSFSLDGILGLMKMCPVKELSLDRVYSFNNVGMEALCFADHLETLELVRCQEISDEGLGLLARYPRLRVLRLTKCLGVTDDGFRPLIGSGKLEVVVVNDCPQVSHRGIQGAAKFVSFKQDLSWMY